MQYKAVRIPGDDNPKYFQGINTKYKNEYLDIRNILMAIFGLDADDACRIARIIEEANIEEDKVNQ